MSADAAPAIETSALRKVFARRAVIEDVSFSVPRGTVYGFLGQNGAGKTTTMRMLLGLIRPSAGRISLLGETVVDGGSTSEARRRAVAHRVGALVEGPSFYPFLSGRKNLQLFARLMGINDNAKVDQYLDEVGLLERSGDLFRVYSRGMKQRLGIAATLIHEPELVLLDEPMNGLDPPGVIHIRELLLERARRGTTIFLSSHLLNDAEQLCQHVGILHKGRLVAEGLLEDLCASDEKIVLLDVAEVEKARALLSEHEAVQQLQDEPDGRLRLHVKDGTAPAINKALVEADIAVKALIPQRRTLENLFLKETEEAKA